MLCPAATQARETGPDLLAHQRRQTLGRFVEDQQARVGDEGATDRQHLLLAAGKLVAEVSRPLPEAREQAVDPGRGPRLALPAAIGEKSQQMLVDRQIRETLPAFRHQRDAGAADAIGSPAVDALAGEADRPALDRLQAADRAQRGRLAHAVAAEQGCRFALGQRQIEPEQDLARAIGDFQSADLEQGAHRWSPR
jgi:hypothetical protein